MRHSDVNLCQCWTYVGRYPTECQRDDISIFPRVSHKIAVVGRGSVYADFPNHAHIYNGYHCIYQYVRPITISITAHGVWLNHRFFGR